MSAPLPSELVDLPPGVSDTVLALEVAGRAALALRACGEALTQASDALLGAVSALQRAADAPRVQAASGTDSRTDPRDAHVYCAGDGTPMPAASAPSGRSRAADDESFVTLGPK